MWADVGHGVYQGSQIISSPCLLQLPTPFQLITEGHEIRWLAALMQVYDRSVYQAMSFAVEIFGAEKRGDLEDGFRINEETT